MKELIRDLAMIAWNLSLAIGFLLMAVFLLTWLDGGL